MGIREVIASAKETLQGAAKSGFAQGKAKRGFINLQTVLQPVLAVLLLFLIIAFVALVMGKTQSTMTANSYEYNITTTGLESAKDISDLGSTLGVVVMGALIIIVLITAFAGGYLMGGRR